jgi:branched-chain amino acid transport system permease protein
MRLPKVAWLALPLIAAIAAPFLLNTDYYLGLLITTVIFAIAALSLDVVIGHMGQFSFGHAAFWGIGAYASAKLTINIEAPVWISLLLAAAATGLVGLLVGLIVMRRNRALELAMVTLGFGVLLATIADRWREFFGGDLGVLGLPALSVPGFEADTLFKQYFFVLAVLIVVLYGMWRVTHSRFGRAVHSLREAEFLGASVGVRVLRHHALAFAGASALGGLAGALYAHFLGFASPTNFELTYMFEFLIIVVIGGAGTLAGPVVGAVVYMAIEELARGASEEARFLIFGVLLLLVIRFLPRGIYPSLRSLLHRPKPEHAT